jgi:hypothetical protein
MRLRKEQLGALANPNKRELMVSLKRIMALLGNTYIHWMRMQALVHRMGLVTDA